MGIRSMNYIVLRPGVALTQAVSKYLNSDTAEIVSNERGTLIVYESNFTPMWARDRRGDNAVFDLEEEIAIQRFLCSLPTDSFHMKRAGEISDHRGDWMAHDFLSESSVVEIEQTYLTGRGRSISS